MKLQYNYLITIPDQDQYYLLGLDGESTTDGSHPSDLGIVRHADAYEPVLRNILKQF